MEMIELKKGSVNQLKRQRPKISSSRLNFRVSKKVGMQNFTVPIKIGGKPIPGTHTFEVRYRSVNFPYNEEYANATFDIAEVD